MKKITCLLCSLFLLVVLFSLPSALAGSAADYAGEWLCTYVDMGDGALQTEYEGQSLPEAIYFELADDGTASLTSFGTTQTGTWTVTGVGISLIVDSAAIPFTYQDNQLVNNDGGIIMYFEKAVKSSGLSSLVGIGRSDATDSFSFAGTWQAVTYEASGVDYDISMFFPDGITMTLAEDGICTVQLTVDYAETLTWSEADSGITLSASYMLFDPVWDADAETLSLCYATDIIRIIFAKADADTQSTQTGTPLPVVYTCDYFTVSFPESWEEDEYGTYTWDQYYQVQYDLDDADGWSISDLSVTASYESVTNYRAELDTLMGYAEDAGRDTLDTLKIDGITFYGIQYGDSYWSNAEYIARVPEASMTLSVLIYAPDEIADVLADILASIHFTYPIPNPVNVDPPLPEHGVVYQPNASSVSAGDYSLSAQWIPFKSSLYPRDSYDNDFAVIGDTLYVQSGQYLYTFQLQSGTLVSASDPLKLDQEYCCLSAANDGTLYISDGFYTTLALKDGALTEYSTDGYLSMNPDGQWGLSFWSSYNVSKLTFTADGMATKDWILTDLSDDALRQGRFSAVYYITVTDDAVFVAGTDATADSSTRIAKYDFDGNELAVFGGSDWMDDSYIGSVAGIVETENGILVQDSFFTQYLLFAPDGTFLGSADCDDLLGTDYPDLISMVPSDSGAMVLVSQERADESATELLVFNITGF